MHRLLLMAILLAAAPGYAAQCFYFWTSDCFEIRDARSRDISHHVLLSAGPYEVESLGGDCREAVNSQVDSEHLQRVLKRFNKVLRKYKACPLLDELRPQVFEDGPAAHAEWQRLQTPRSFKEIHNITRLPED